MILVRVFSDVLVFFPCFDICQILVANIKIWKSHLNIREGSRITLMYETSVCNVKCWLFGVILIKGG